MARRRSALLVAVAGVAVFAFWTFTRAPHDGDASRVGGTIDLVESARWPLDWKGDDLISFQTWTGVTTVRVDGTIVASTREPYPTLEGPSGFRVEADARFGRWRAWSAGVHLISEGDERCGPPLVPSPDGTFVACVHTVTDRLHETSEAFGAVIRVR